MKTSVIGTHAMLSVWSVEEVERRIGEVPGVASVTVNVAARSATVRYDETRLDVGDIKSVVRQRGYESAAPATTSASDGHEGHPAPGRPGSAPAAPAAATEKSAPDAAAAAPVSGTDAVKADSPHAKSGDAVAAELGVDPQNGLSDAESATLRASVGPNSLPPPKRAPLWRRIVSQISSPIVLTLLGAAVISVVVGARGSAADGLFTRYGDAIAILLIVLLNAALGFVQESKAESAVSALGKLSVPRARVRREGRTVTLSAEELVPGDILELEAGDAIPADARLLEMTELQVQEASLTGESLPVEKDAGPVFAGETPLADRLNMVFLGTAVVGGRATAVVTATGARTELGRIGTLITSATKETTPLEAMLEKFGRRVLVVCLALSLLLFLWGLARPWIFSGSVAQPWHLLLLAAVSLAVAAIPEGLPAITTITLALGTQRLAKRGAIVRHLPAVETLGAATFICTDKTGTLTQNLMMARAVWTLDGSYAVEGDGYAPEGSVHSAESQPNAPPLAPELLLGALVCNHAALEQEANAWRPVGDPTEAALVTLAARGGLSTDQVRSQYPIVQEIPFGSARLRMTVFTEAGGKRLAWMKGAFDVVLDHCATVARTAGPMALTPALRAAVEAGAEQLAQSGLRVLAIAYRADPEGDVEAGLTFLGLVGLMDPPRAGVKEAIVLCQCAGIVVAMITGDHPTTATAIAKEIGLFRTGDVTMTGAELDALSDDEFRSRVEPARIFAQTSPEQKLRIVRAFKALGHVVAMTGDGVNDAPALREAHIGVAMGLGGTDVARQAADIVLADDDFSTIVHAIREGRVIYRNIQKFIFFLLSANAGLSGAVFLAAIISDWPPFTPLMLLWVNLVTNGLPALALGIDPTKEDVMTTAPRALGQPLLLTKDWVAIGVVGVLMTATSALFHVHPSSPPELMLRARALGFTYLALGALLHAFSCSSAGSVVFKLSVFKRPLTIAIVVSAAVHAVAVLVPPLRPVFKTYPLDWADVAKLSVACLAVVPAFELWKWLARIRARSTPSLAAQGS
ncbi:MAG: cation-translocating P-type ATPase [Myxococcales bacterium]|nr:cation-translocating P-type ATPase [Myxococcales bacterium]